MPAYNGFFAAIDVDGEPLNEYQVQINDAENEISCWVPSQVGKEFAISFEISSPDKDMCLKAIMDGSRGFKRHLAKQRGKIEAMLTSSTTERPFVFSEVQLVDDDDIKGEIPDLNNLGTIILLFREGHVTRGLKRRSVFDNKIPEQTRIPERGKKGVQTCVGLGAVRARVPGRPIIMNYSGNATRMIFRYRPLDYLQAQGIAPLPPPPPPKPASPDPQRAPTTNEIKRKRVEAVKSQPGPSKTRRMQTEGKKLADMEISDDEDIEKLLALQDRISKVLAKKNVAVKKEIKAEPRAVFLKGEVIDLT